MRVGFGAKIHLNTKNYAPIRLCLYHAKRAILAVDRGKVKFTKNSSKKYKLNICNLPNHEVSSVIFISIMDKK